MKKNGTKLLTVFTLLTLPLQLNAQSQTLSASPIPDGVESRFCYYAGLAYSKQSYIIIRGSDTATATSSEIQERLLECIASDDGTLNWVGRSKVQTDR